MKKCSICRKIEITPGCFDDYKQLAHYHYCRSRPGPYKKIFVLRNKSLRSTRKKILGIVVYSMPFLGLELRSLVMNNFFCGFDKDTQIELINKNIRCISRVIIEPRFRGLGLAQELVRQTMPKMNVSIIEAVAVMGRINPFLEKAGMKPYTSKPSKHCTRFIEALSIIGIEDKDLIDPQKVQRKLSRLNAEQTDFIEREFKHFLKGYGNRRNMPAGLERTRYVLSRLNARPVYYVWFNKTISDFRF